jgi:hypothetical protein
MVTQIHDRFPSDFRYSPGQDLPGGVRFLCLRTLDELAKFWKRQRDTLPYAVGSTSGHAGVENWFLQPYEWIFAPSRAAAIRAVLRWDHYRIHAVWFDWASECPAEHAEYFRVLQQTRVRYKAAGAWTAQQERDFQRRTPETYRGWWELTNLPARLPASALLGDFPDEIFDRSLTAAQVEEKFQLQIFESYKGLYSSRGHMETFDRAAMDRHIDYCFDDRRRGGDYYGSCNEARSA